jgi:hypothetical protein
VTTNERKRSRTTPVAANWSKTTAITTRRVSVLVTTM